MGRSFYQTAASFVPYAGTAYRMYGRYQRYQRKTAKRTAVSRVEAARKAAADYRRRAPVPKKVTGDGPFSVRKMTLRGRRPAKKNVYDQLNTHKLTMQLAEANEYEDTQGQLQLGHNSVLGDCPLHFHEITGIYNNSVNPLTTTRFMNNTVDPFGTMSRYSTRVDADGGTSAGTNGDEISRAILKSCTLSLLLRGCPKRAMRYRIMLFRTKDSSFVPNPNESDIRTQDGYHFWQTKLRQFTQNPCRQTPNVQRRTKQGIEVLMTRDIIINEQSSDHDAIPKKHVKIHKAFNKLLNYQTLPGAIINPSVLGENVADATNTDVANSCGNYPQYYQRYFWAIFAQETRDSASSNNELTGFTSPSYDIDMVTRFEVASS